MSAAVWRVRGGRTLDATARTLVMGVNVKMPAASFKKIRKAVEKAAQAL